ncbi:EF-hand domain-containing protein [Amycolatopsis minnesotensis]|uniref:EF-hand domain-containing protein n=1 Tax=Amycolatopsis minnesotensis TaxID=337894 RepID=A0ABN2QAF2_9PSEU
MASEFQRRKISTVFSALDADHDGFLDESDFEALAARWTGIRGGEQDTPGHERLRSIMIGWWAILLASSDLDRDDKVTLDEVLIVVDRLPKTIEAVTNTADAMFEAVDENGDGRISEPEYQRMIEAWTGRTDTGEIFALLDLDGDGSISQAEFAQHWAEFWAGDDPAAPGSSVFGKVSPDAR